MIKVRVLKWFKKFLCKFWITDDGIIKKYIKKAKEIIVELIFRKKSVLLQLGGLHLACFVLFFHSSDKPFGRESFVLLAFWNGSVDRAALSHKYAAAAREPMTERLVGPNWENHASLKESTPITGKRMSLI